MDMSDAAPHDERPSPITATLIHATDDSALEGLLFDHVLELQRRSPESLDTLPEAFQAHFIAFLMDSEVLNGGFNQFWFNSPGFAADAPWALQRLELHDAAVLAHEASTLYESVRERHERAREQGGMDAFMATYKDTPFQAVDTAYIARESDWRDGRIAYIRGHVGEFVHPL